ncbi:phage head-tail connector protein [Enterococcus olivae]
MNKTNKDALDKLQEQLARKFDITDETEKQILADDLEDCLAEVLDYCNRETLEGNMAKAVKDLFVIRSNQEGNEGEESRSEGGVTRNFETGMPKHLRTMLNKYRLGSVTSL